MGIEGRGEKENAPKFMDWEVHFGALHQLRARLFKEYTAFGSLRQGRALHDHGHCPHTRIDNDIIDADIPKMGTIGFAIFVVLKRHLNQKTGDCYPSYKTIARKVGIDRSTVIRYVKKLTALHLVSPELRFKEDGSPSSNQYDLQKTGHAAPAKNQAAGNAVPAIIQLLTMRYLQKRLLIQSKKNKIVAQNHHPWSQKTTTPVALCHPNKSSLPIKKNNDGGRRAGNGKAKNLSPSARAHRDAPRQYHDL